MVRKTEQAVMAAPAISVVVPTYNEESTIGGLLKNVAALRPHEIVVADGDSTDSTIEIASRHARVLRLPACRAAQMNAAARTCTGDVLLFLHADVRLAAGALDAIRDCLRDPVVVGGNFDIRYEGGDLTAAVFTLVNRWRRRLGVMYGDSGIFCRREVFEVLGGYRPWPILEDYEFARRLRKAGRVARLNVPIRVSDRRWRKGGLARTLWIWFWIQTLYYAGVSPHRLAKWYRATR